MLEGGDAAYPAMLAAIGDAKHCIAMASYIFRDDAAGRAFADALIAAHRRGVEVRVLLDSVGIGYFFPAAFYRLKAGGVPAARFLHTWLPWRMPFLNMRNHRKLLVVDGALAFMGGMNIGAEHSHRLAGGDYIEDIHFQVEGPVARSLMDAFARDWTFTTEEAAGRGLLVAAASPEQGRVQARGLRSGPDADIYKIEMLAGAALTLARKRIRIVTPYFLPDQRLQFAIAQACMRGVEVDIVLPEHSDHTYMEWAMYGHLRFFKHIAANIYLSPPPFDHSKLMTMDGEWSLIGSSNWDARSFRLNFEYDLECYDPDLTGELDAIIDAKIARARKLTIAKLASRPVPIRLSDAAARLLDAVSLAAAPVNGQQKRPPEGGLFRTRYQRRSGGDCETARLAAAHHQADGAEAQEQHRPGARLRNRGGEAEIVQREVVAAEGVDGVDGAEVDRARRRGQIYRQLSGSRTPASPGGMVVWLTKVGPGRAVIVLTWKSIVEGELEPWKVHVAADIHHVGAEIILATRNHVDGAFLPDGEIARSASHWRSASDCLWG